MFEFLGHRGARNILVTSSRGVRDGNQQLALQALFDQGINVRTSSSLLTSYIIRD